MGGIHKAAAEQKLRTEELEIAKQSSISKLEALKYAKAKSKASMDDKRVRVLEGKEKAAMKGVGLGTSSWRLAAVRNANRKVAKLQASTGYAQEKAAMLGQSVSALKPLAGREKATLKGNEAAEKTDVKKAEATITAAKKAVEEEKSLRDKLAAQKTNISIEILNTKASLSQLKVIYWHKTVSPNVSVLK